MIPRKPRPSQIQNSSLFHLQTPTTTATATMDSINFFKGYGKINNNLTEAYPHKPPIVKITITAILLLTLLIGLVFAALVHVSDTEATPKSSSSLNSLQSLKSVCTLTQYPNTCLTSLNTSTKPDPVSISNLSLTLAVKELSSFSLYVKKLSGKSNDAALSDCGGQLEDALSQLSDSVAELGKKGLCEESVGNVRTWVSAAMTDGETCLDGLEEMGSSLVDEVKARMEKSKELMSIALALFAKMDEVFKMCGMTMH